MRPIWKRKRFSIFSKLVLTFLIVMVPFYLLGISMTDKGKHLVGMELSKSLEQQMQFYLVSLETEIERMTALQREFINDEDLDTLAMLPEKLTTYERLTAVNRLQARLNLIKESSAYIVNVNAYIPSISKVVSSNASVNPLDSDKLEELKAATFQSIPPLYNEGNDLFIREYYPSPYNLDLKNPSFVLELQISTLTLDRFLEQLPGNKDGGAVFMHGNALIVSDKHKAVFDKVMEDLNQYFASPAIISQDPYGENRQPQIQTRTLILNHESYLTVHLYSPELDSHLIVYVPENKVMGPLQKYRTYMWLISVLSLLIILLFAYWIYRIIHRPLRKLVRAFRKVESGVMQAGIQHNSNDEFHYLYERFNAMVDHLNKLVFEVYEHKINLQQSELKQLQSQINPHFLYNSFYLLYRMTRAQDIETATRFTRFLGDYYQYITRNGSDEVVLEEEIRHVRAYTEIQSIRFGGRIQVAIEPIPEDCSTIIVPRLVLQPIVENAYQHGFDGELSEYRLEIHFVMERSSAGEPLLVLQVKDNGIGLSEAELQEWRGKLDNALPVYEVTGILNVHRRLRMKYGGAGGIRLNRADIGLEVALLIPCSNRTA
ncbi:histidine kinase [Paenibacillus sp. HB172176]|uniref:sensor histidine kinase n=1 Tax=Paenibacillus sp. HB172176 TaxID=2493690 RepID=UPI00143AAAD2|nr:histidine kinase [Paenibacillus sp. HB172176]